ncbi:unnamed protein product [Brassica napus]|uniref:(rape) hypothetical protein n=1 Tax=Brassica napus TaxID=3708 RepID=A0A816SD96_BRANA|nr:unnamed protein product [Brassica napus]
MHSFQISPNPARKVSRKMQLNSLLFRQPETVFVRKQCCNVKSKTTLATDISARIDEEHSEMRYLVLEASSATDRLFPGKGRRKGESPWVPDPVAAGAVSQSGCLGMQLIGH